MNREDVRFHVKMSKMRRKNSESTVAIRPKSAQAGKKPTRVHDDTTVAVIASAASASVVTAVAKHQEHGEELEKEDMLAEMEKPGRESHLHSLKPIAETETAKKRPTVPRQFQFSAEEQELHQQKLVSFCCYK